MKKSHSVRAFPGLKIETGGTRRGMGTEFVEDKNYGDRFVLSHPCDKNKNVARMGHPE